VYKRQIAALPPLLQACGAVQAPEWAARVRRCHADLVAQGRDLDLQPQDFDTLFWGQALAPRVLDARIARALSRIQDATSSPVTAQACAAEAHLSFSRFLHLFKQEVGAPFRSVRTWKRARSLLHHVNREQALVNVALDIGYPDSTHFSHSIRQTFGLKPRDIFAGSRKLRIIGGSMSPAHAYPCLK
jgi:AraC-like DNA-binding protein